MSKSGQKSEHYRWRNGGKTLPTVSGRVGTRPHPQRTAACGSINTIRQNDARTFNLRTLVQNSMMTSAPPHTVEGLSELRVGPGGSLLSCNFPRSPRTPKWASTPSLTTMKPYFFIFWDLFSFRWGLKKFLFKSENFLNLKWAHFLFHR